MMQSIHKLLLTIALLGSAALFSPLALADTDIERDNLARIAHELRALQAQVREAAQRADATNRVKFRYDWLERDLALVEGGIAQHLDAPRQPRPVPPLSGDYRQ